MVSGKLSVFLDLEHPEEVPAQFLLAVTRALQDDLLYYVTDLSNFLITALLHPRADVRLAVENAVTGLLRRGSSSRGGGHYVVHGGVVRGRGSNKNYVVHGGVSGHDTNLVDTFETAKQDLFTVVCAGGCSSPSAQGKGGDEVRGDQDALQPVGAYGFTPPFDLCYAKVDPTERDTMGGYGAVGRYRSRFPPFREVWLVRERGADIMF